MNKTIIEPGSINQVYDILFRIKAKKIFFIHRNNSFEKSGAKSKLKLIFEKFEVIEYYEFSLNPKLEDALAGQNLFIENKCDIILCVGGGSVIDMGKLIKYLLIKNKTYINLIAVPTTAGTGSEATQFAVVYINGEKNSYESKELLPNYSIIDSNLLIGQSKYQIAVSGIDAFSQAIESMWSINSNSKSINYAEEAIYLLWNNLQHAINGDILSMQKISNAANLAGKAINITKTTAPHAFSYSFTSNFGLPHGHAVALFLPYFIHIHKQINIENCMDKRGVSHVIKIMQRIAELIKADFNVLEFNVLEFINNLGVSINFKNLGITFNDYSMNVKNVNMDRLKNNPLIISEKHYKLLYEYNNEFSI